MSVKVSKFGGTSLADAAQIRKVIDILRSDAERRFLVPSAPGKRHADDEKITDLLLTCHRMAENGEDTTGIFNYICGRYDRIVEDLGLKLDLSGEYALIARNLKRGASRDYLVSRGEYLCARLLAAALDWEFIDAAEVILFDARGRFNPDGTHEKLSARLRVAKNAVIPGFYGSMPDGRIKTFSRGGSDISGALVARAISASVYENWTDVPGFMMADPHIVSGARIIDIITYRRLRFAYMGAQVLHEDSIFPAGGYPDPYPQHKLSEGSRTLIVAGLSPAPIGPSRVSPGARVLTSSRSTRNS